jgi:succinyl-CoA synthetase beta subunit
MRIFEYQGKELFKTYGIPVPQGVMIDEKREIGKICPDIDRGNGVVLKAQVLVGGRGKAKGIRFAESAKECENQYDELINLSISGHPVRKILLEERIKINRNYILASLSIRKPVNRF